MNAMKSIMLIVLLLSVFTLFLVPMESGLFPTWIDEDLVQFMLIVLIVVFGLVLIK